MKPYEIDKSFDFQENQIAIGTLLLALCMALQHLLGILLNFIFCVWCVAHKIGRACLNFRPHAAVILTCSSDVEDHSAQYWYAEQTIA